MGLNKSKGNMYPWVTHTWNTIKGKCPHDCSYCYMKRWGELKPVRFDEKELNTDLGSGNKIFVGSSCDIFAWGIDIEWIYRTLDHCQQFDNEYLFQSKNVSRMLVLSGNFPERTMVCTTIETNRDYPEIMRNSPPVEVRAKSMSHFPKKFKRCVTIEPIMKFDRKELVELIRISGATQVNIGADSGRNNLPEPTWGEVGALISDLQKFAMVVQKSNLNRLNK